MTFCRMDRRHAGGLRTLGRMGCALVACAVLTAGCRSMRPTSAVPKPVEQSRQLSQRALSAMQRRDWPAAERFLADAVQVCPNDVDARRHYAETLWQRGERELALQHATQAMNMSPDDVTLAVRVGEIHLALGQLAEAGRLAEAALDSNPNQAGAWALRGRVQQATGQYERALADLQRALEFRPHDADLLLDTAEVYRGLNRPQRALSALMALRETFAPGEEPQHVLYLEGLALDALARHDAAADCFAQALTRGPPTTELLYRLAECRFHAGHQAEADRVLEQALAIEPQHGPSLALLQRLQVASQSALGPYR